MSIILSIDDRTFIFNTGIDDEIKCYLLQYMIKYGNARLTKMGYLTNSSVGELMEDFNKRYQLYYNSHNSWRRNMFDILNPLPVNENIKHDLSNISELILRDGVVDFLSPCDIFKLCLMSHNFYDALYYLIRRTII